MRYTSCFNDQNSPLIIIGVGSTVDLINQTQMFASDSETFMWGTKEFFILAHLLINIKIYSASVKLFQCLNWHYQLRNQISI